ncbi:MarR family winged helix-turn-helix transcriptional regulator [Undibacter mobilis]|uniref:MarR family transcriptional regulator n=1 Tax=Undibacter mobilis TaxID=2292256 RepID=A0A371B6P0_9BRAD|nr:MarR family transcriptional regulator [Undibacter mobilis]RDV03265.1 MarR family transcriptional regulator [Undibacter mobilis]
MSESRPLARAGASVVDRESASPQDEKLELRVWLRFLSVFKIVEGKLRTRLRSNFDISTPRFDVLAILHGHSGAMTMGELSSGLMVTTGNVTGIVDMLIDEGLVSKSPNPVDRRSHLIEITPAGRRLFARIAPALAKWFEDAMSEMTAAEIKELQRLLGKFKASANKWQ